MPAPAIAGPGAGCGPIVRVMTLWLLACAFLLMCGCLAATWRRANRTWMAAVACVSLTLLIYVLLSDVPIGVSL